MDKNRRNFMKKTGLAIGAATGLTGCLGSQNNNTAITSQYTSQDNNTTANEKSLLEQTHSADKLDGVVPELEQDSVPLNFVPADENAEYRNSNIFDQYSTDNPNALTVEIDLNQAMQQRHNVDPEIWGEDGERIQEFIENVDNPEWRNDVLEEAKENYGEEYEDVLDWDTYTDQELSFDERMKQSGMMTFWYIFERGSYGGISSTNNQYKAHAFQGIEQKAGFDTFIWDFRIPSHGLVPAIENPTRSEDETDSQETYIIETDPGDGQQVTRMENSQYKDDEPFNGENERNKAGGLYEYTAIETRETHLADSLQTSREIQNQFVKYFHNPESSPAYDHIDPMNVAAYIAEENILKGDLQGEIDLETDSITIRR